ncbi:uncharacterized protein LOC125490592 [Plutella xylostella]|uniref:uncharacterized protein LOC125490592 n=1 Tax=Plutella xylostella TaxID=51655 RepID=UPI0020322A38|nr:uncharacterized protein LOC125490592 [Plutella xylostella]
MSEINTNKKTIIDEFLTFVQNKIDIIDDVSLIQICATNFSDAEIDTGKSVLFQEISGARCVNRKGEDKKKKNIKDVIVLLKATDPDVQPTFVAKNLDRLPPVTFDHVDVTRLLKDLTLLKSEMLDLKTNSVSKSEFITLQDELSRLRSRWTPDQTRVAVQKKPFSKKQPSQFNNSNGLTGRSSISTQNSPATASRAYVKGDIRAPMLTSSEQDSGPVSEPAAACPPSPESAMPTDDEFVDAEISHTPTYRDILRSEGGTVDRMPNDNKGVNDNGFTTVSHKKRSKNKNMRGTLQSSNRLQVVEPACAIYVSRLMKHITEKDIQEHFDDMNEKCLSVELLMPQRETSFNSFKVMIPGSKVGTILNNNFWPAGLVYRRYRERTSRLTRPNSTNNG